MVGVRDVGSRNEGLGSSVVEVRVEGSKVLGVRRRDECGRKWE